MKTAIIGLPMVGKTSLFTILTGVTQESRIGSTAVRTGIAKVPDPRVDALAELYKPPKIHRYPGHFKGNPARPRLPRQPARRRRLCPRAPSL
jgi:ribosome-binding ATPase YchF (GTP1/OBG family)